MQKRTKLAMNLQTFAEGSGEGGAAGGEGTTPPAGNQSQIDYDKLASIVAGKQSATEESVLKGYFKQQGLSKEQMDQAIAAYKEQQAANQPDIAGMQNQITETQNQLTAAQKAAQDAQVETAATMMAVSLGVEAKTIPYVLKMADFSQVTGEDGKINEESLKAAVNKVLEGRWENRIFAGRYRRESSTALTAGQYADCTDKTLESLQHLKKVSESDTERRYKIWH